MDITSSTVIRSLFSSFKRLCPPREIKPPEWILSLVLRSLACLPYEPLKLSYYLLHQPNWLASCTAFSIRCITLKRRRSCIFSFLPDFVAKTQNPSVYEPCFKEFTAPLLADLLDEDRDEMLLCPIRALKRYLSGTEQFRLECPSLFVSKTKTKKRVSQNVISVWIIWVISHTYQSATDEGCRTVKVMRYGRLVLLFSFQ